ncbi:hypothetical protein KP77_28240 [Jeotgalibacillus alimentarius]|uniref:Uncharacterized protein n=1 Tax=Jeotgalibacillus alimentarius TaxID=135826 RepID=A0A0C2VCM9_9BACL|nr:hypothetical protein [Jeotgalibacillus alimentarius]KIL46697.1 hypothetical protein KP77_28240 [Jeotgalibacillus alimentarius]
MVAVMIVAAVAIFYFRMAQKPPVHPDNELIGTSKIIDGIEYFNIGDLYDCDNWIKVGPVF